VAIGNFDGVHLGHRKVVEILKKRAVKCKGASVVVAFDPHPEHVLSPETGPKLLTTVDEKRVLLEELGVDAFVALAFDTALAELPPLQFIRRYMLEQLGAGEIVVGRDHRFGRRAEGDADFIRKTARELGLRTEVVEPVLQGGKQVSSTWIRKWLAHGDLERANALLGHPYLIAGEVVRGEGVGRRLGFPTCNLRAASPHKLVPSGGVYRAKVKVGESTFSGAFYVGSRPTFEGALQRMEVHLLDFNGDLYGEYVLLYVFQRIREDRKFRNAEELSVQIQQDVEMIRQWKEEDRPMALTPAFGKRKNKMEEP
jgi:riboflavin kinase/FMN adenylyltransferase